MNNSIHHLPMKMSFTEAEFGIIRDACQRVSIPIPPALIVGESDEGPESERERLLRVWRLHPEAEVDLCSEEEQGGPDDGTGLVRMTEKDGTEVDEFRFASGEEADEAVVFALRAMNPNA